jgi:stage V sporulation protein AD
MKKNDRPNAPQNDRLYARPCDGPRNGANNRAYDPHNRSCRLKNQTMMFVSKPFIRACSTVAGPKEGQGRLKSYFDTVLEDDCFGEKTFEKAECKMFKHVLSDAIFRAGLSGGDIDFIFSGDLLNQIISATFSARDFDAMHVGLYSACATMAESLALGALFLDGGFAKNVLCATGSHFSSAERQYRYPLEYGSLRPAFSQWTITGAGAMLLTSGDGEDVGEIKGGKEGGERARTADAGKTKGGKTDKIAAGTAGATGASKGGAGNTVGSAEGNTAEVASISSAGAPASVGTPARPKITSATLGKIVDYNIKDANNMGAAMAPAAADTLLAHLNDRGVAPDYYDLILTGDLGLFGSNILKDLMKKSGVALNNHDDCGAMIYKKEPEVFQGGSGAGCSAVVLNGYVYKKLLKRELNKVLFVATGALLSTLTTQQGESIPAIAHAVSIEN